MSDLGFLTADAWLDHDGVHIWLAHDCTDGRTTTMLPFPTWHASDDRHKVEPSVSCLDCGLHAFVPLLDRDHHETPEVMAARMWENP